MTFTVDVNALYRKKLLQIPTPRFVVFYNGTEKQPERRLLRLSDSFQKQVDTPDLELRVLMLNINLENNRELLEQCRTLHDYMVYVEKVRTYRKSMPLEAAVETAVDECIAEGVLAEFFHRNKAEVISMSIFEYNEEAALKYIREDEREEGRSEGRAEGKYVNLIGMVRKKYVKGIKSDECAEMLDEDIDLIQKIYSLLQGNPGMENETIYKELRKLISTEA